jgi:uncharacterized protein (TIGR02145 family)
MIIVALICSAAFTSCKSRGSGDVKLLESITVNDDRIQKKFEYDGQNRLVKIYHYGGEGLYYTSTVTYTDALVTVNDVFSDNSSGATKFAINGNTITVEVVALNSSETLTVNKDGYIVKKEGDKSLLEDWFYTYQYRDGNLIKREFKRNELEGGNSAGYTNDYTEYDSKKQPFSNSGTPKWLLQYLLDVAYAKNNILEDVWDGEETGSAKYEYEYDSDGFPTRQTCHVSGSGYDGDGTTIIRFTYFTKTKNASVKAETAVGEKEQSDLKPEGLPSGAVLTVSTAWEFIAALGSDRIIELNPGRYNLSQLGADAPINSEGYIDAEFLPEGVGWYESGVSLHGIGNLTIRGANGERAPYGSKPSEIVVDPDDGYVLSFVDCRDIVIDGIAAGHTVGGHCTGGVFSFEGSTRITINGASMYGSGTEGLTLTNVVGMRVTNSRIYECTYYIMTIDSGGDIDFEKCRFDNNREFSMINVSNAKDVSFTDCEFIDNEVSWGNMFSVWNTKVAVSRCTFRGNKIEGNYVGSANPDVPLSVGSGVSFSDCGFDNAFIDQRDGMVYKFVKIGGKTWMAENLRYEADKSWCYDNSQSRCAEYGRLYDWNTAMEACPEGWHLPTAKEWDDLVKAAGGEHAAGKRLKPTRGWAEHEGNSGNGTDDYGFAALPGGFQIGGEEFANVGISGNWWTATESDGNNAFCRNIFNNSDGVHASSYSRRLGLSVRCVRN